MERRRPALLAVLLAALAVLLARPAAAATGPDPRLRDQYGLLDIKAPQAWAQGKGGGISVAIVSTGIAEHEDLDSKVEPGFDATGDSDPRADAGGRGTHLAGIVGAATDNAVGIAAVAPDARLVPFKAFKAESADDTYLEALNRARSSKVVLVDIPATYSGSKETLRQTLKTLGQRVSVVVGAQSGVPLDDLPVLAVTATSSSGGQSGAGVGPGGVAAPGVGILSTTSGALLPTAERYGELSGTSQAAAHVAGAVAILRGLGAGVAQAADVLRATARKGDASLGAGAIDVAAAVAAYQAPPPAPTTTATTKAAAAPVPTTQKPAPSTTVAEQPFPSSGPVFDGAPVPEFDPNAQAVPPPNLDEFLEETDRGPSVLVGGRERPWGALTIGFGALFVAGSALSVTFRRLGAEPS